MPRPTKLTPDLQAKIVQGLTSGATVEKVCEYVGIDKGSYYNWMKRGRAAKDGIFFDFFNAATYAQSATHIRAAVTLRGAMDSTKSVTDTTETTVETRLRKVKKPDGSIVEEPYEYRKTITRQSVTVNPPDWRAAVEFLKRRDNESWSDKTTIKVDDWRMRLLSDIQQGTVKLADVIREFGSQQDFMNAINEPSLAAQLFAAAGVQLQDREG